MNLDACERKDLLGYNRLPTIGIQFIEEAVGTADKSQLR
jgi:hypothetical protein